MKEINKDVLYEIKDLTQRLMESQSSNRSQEVDLQDIKNIDFIITLLSSIKYDFKNIESEEV